MDIAARREMPARLCRRSAGNQARHPASAARLLPRRPSPPSVSTGSGAAPGASGGWIGVAECAALRADPGQPACWVASALAWFRVRAGSFLEQAGQQGWAVGLTHVQHQLLVAVKGHPGDLPPTVGDIASYLLLRHHSAVELIDRAEVAGLVRRTPDPQDARIVRVKLTSRGDQLVIKLTQAHLAELRKLAVVLSELAPGGRAAITGAGIG